jgi:hypothetical protein
LNCLTSKTFESALLLMAAFSPSSHARAAEIGCSSPAAPTHAVNAAHTVLSTLAWDATTLASLPRQIDAEAVLPVLGRTASGFQNVVA